MTKSSESRGLKAWRKGRGMTLAQAATYFGIGGANAAETYRRYETGMVWPPAETLDVFVHLTEGDVGFDEMVKTRIAARSKEEAA